MGIGGEPCKPCDRVEKSMMMANPLKNFAGNGRNMNDLKINFRLVNPEF